MSFSARYLPAILLAIVSLSTSLLAQSTTKQPAKVPRGSLSGRVTVKDKGLPGVAVGVRKGEPGSSAEPFMRTTTDQDGFYRLTNLAAGSYNVTASAPAYVMPNPYESRFKMVLIGEDEDVEGINFSLLRGGVVTGRLTDADGRPVIDQQVQVYPASLLEQRGQQRTIYPLGVAQTDDRGIYRVFGLSAGRYKVAAGRNDDEENVSYNQPRNTSYRQVFHPDVTDQAKATVVEVSEGGEAANVDITLGRTLQTFSASGVVIDNEKNLPAPNLRFGVQRVIGARAEFVNVSVMSNSRGELLIEGLPAGKYSVYLYPDQGTDLRAGSLSFEIKDQDISGLTVRLGRGAIISGVIVLESEDKSAWEKLSQLQLRGHVIAGASGMAMGSTAMSPIGPDGSFRLAGLGSGQLNFVLTSKATPLPPKGFNIARVERDGVVAPRGLEIKEGEQLTGVRLSVVYGTATVRGVIKVENGPLPEGSHFFVRLTRSGESIPALRPGAVDARGHFMIEGIPAGTYDLTGMITGPFRPRMTTQAITVTDGAMMDVMVKIDFSAPVKP
jgi:hypothetical protein